MQAQVDFKVVDRQDEGEPSAVYPPKALAPIPHLETLVLQNLGCVNVKKDTQCESCKLRFIWGKMRAAAWETAMEQDQYIRFSGGGVQCHEAVTLRKVFC